MQFLQRAFGKEQERFVSHQPQVALVVNVAEKVGLKLQPGRQALDESTVLFLIRAFHDSDQAVAHMEFPLKLKVVSPVLIFRGNEVVAAGAELQAHPGKGDASEEQQDLGVEEPIWMMLQCPSQFAQQAPGQVFMQGSHCRESEFSPRLWDIPKTSQVTAESTITQSGTHTSEGCGWTLTLASTRPQESGPRATQDARRADSQIERTKRTLSPAGSSPYTM